MQQTYCQRCGSVNPGNAQVCQKCGIRLAHQERRWWNRLKNSGVGDDLRSAPWRFCKWLFRKLKLLVYTIFILAVLLGGLLYFFLFVPLSWDDYAMPQPLPEKMDDEFLRTLRILEGAGGSFTADPKTVRQLGNLLIFSPRNATRRAWRRNSGKTETSKLGPDRQKGYFSFVKMPHDEFGMVLYQKFYDKLPFRVFVVFAARRNQKGKLELARCRIGNLPVPASLARRAAEKMLNRWNPKQQFLPVFDRIIGGEMILETGGKEELVTVKVRPNR